MHMNRRQALQRGLFGAGLWGLRSLATGLPISFLMNPRQALADATTSAPTYLIVATSSYGDAVNANAPGTYVDDSPGAAHVVHPTTDGLTPMPGFAAADLTLGGKTYVAAEVWAGSKTNPTAFPGLSSALKARTAFFHHATLTANHGDEPRVLKLMGAVRRDEMLTSFISKTLQGRLGTIQPEPIALAQEAQQFEGKYQPRLTPTGLKSVLSAPTGLQATLQKMRDDDLSSLNSLLKGSRSTTAQLAYLNNLAQSQSDLRTLAEKFGDDLSAITKDDAMNQAIAAPLLIRMGVTPVIAIHLPFSGDNHTDTAWSSEADQHASSVAVLNTLYAQLETYGLQDQTTFVCMNVFGRELTTPIEGRTHNAAHAVAVMFGPAIKAGVIGGVSGNSATAIDAQTGESSANGGIAMTDTLATMGKTLAAACGVPTAAIEDQITKGVILNAALKS
jgi:hypothetical protein